MKDKQTVGKWNAPSYEKIAELSPQAVIAYGKWPGEELEKKLEPLTSRRRQNLFWRSLPGKVVLPGSL